MIVADASTLVRAVLEPRRAGAGADRRRVVHVPHLVDVEGRSALRWLTPAGRSPARRAAEAPEDFSALVLERCSHAVLAARS